MEKFETVPKKWGNSIGVTIPSDIIKHEGIDTRNKVTVLIMRHDRKRLKEIFGTLKLKKSTQQIMDEIDEGYD